MVSSSRLLAEQRQTLILERVGEAGMVRTVDLAAEMNVAGMTIRRDLAELQERGHVVLIHGGAKIPAGRIPPADRRERAAVELEAKRAIGRSAAEQLSSGDVVYLDSGTTCAAIVPYLTGLENLTVVTNDLTTATDLVAEASHVRVLMAGGLVDSQTLSTVGDLFPAVLMNLRFDVALVSASAWDIDAGATTGGMAYSAAKRVVLSRAKRSLLLVDSSKYGASQAHVIRRLDGFSAVISDSQLAIADQATLRTAGVHLTVADH